MFISGHNFCQLFFTHSLPFSRISDSSVSSSDKYGFIKNFESTIDFDIDDNLMVFLEEQGVDTNPKDEEVRFELNCAVEQGDQSYVQIVPIRMTVSEPPEFVPIFFLSSSFYFFFRLKSLTTTALCRPTLSGSLSES